MGGVFFISFILILQETSRKGEWKRRLTSYILTADKERKGKEERGIS